ncbi:MAG: MarR family winged helix-turn-helix transcriptional regulator [Thermotaleaceae bacterium]
MHRIGQLNAAIYRNMQIFLGNRLSGLDIKNGQYDFFLVISLYEGISQKEVSEHLHIGKSTTAKAVKNLVSKGYVRKEKDEKDGRVDHLFLTDKGRKEAPFVEAIFEENQRVAEIGLTKAESNQLLFLMNKVLNNFVANNELHAGGGNEDE